MLTTESQRGATRAASEGEVTADMVAQWAYCERRLYLAYADGRWADNEHTDEGRWVHRNADRPEPSLAPDPGDPEAPRVTRSVELAWATPRLRARLDLLESGEDGKWVPVEVKKAALPPGAQPYPPERVQVGFQAALLRLHGHNVEEAHIYYAASRMRVKVPITEELLGEVDAAIDGVRGVLAAGGPPPPLVDSPKCPKCSLVGICLPDETLRLRASGEVGAVEVRRLFPPRDDAAPLYVQTQGAQVGKRGECLLVSLKGQTLAETRLLDVSQLVLCGHIGISAAATHLLCEASVPIVHLSMGHWFYGMTVSTGPRNAFDRAAQFARAAEPAFCLSLAKEFVKAKGRNQRTMLRRNGPSEAPVLRKLAAAIRSVDGANDVGALLGAEGNIAALYFQAFGSMLRPRGGEAEPPPFDVSSRNRRPPKDPVNAMLSFGYSLLAKDATLALLATGLDPYWGVYHRPRHGRPALALDLMEEFRPLIVDSAVITAINTGMVEPGSFEFAAGAVMLNESGRRAFLRAYEGRMDQLMTHPTFAYRLSWRRALHLQAQLLARVFRGDVPAYEGLTTR